MMKNLSERLEKYSKTWDSIREMFDSEVRDYPYCKKTPKEFIQMLVDSGLEVDDIQQTLAILIISKPWDGRFWDYVRKYYTEHCPDDIKDYLKEAPYPKGFKELDDIHSSHLNSTALAFMQLYGAA